MARHAIVTSELHLDVVTGSKRARVYFELTVQGLRLEAEITTDLLLVCELSSFKSVSIDWAVNLNLLFAEHLDCFRLVKLDAHDVAASASESFDLGRVGTN